MRNRATLAGSLLAFLLVLAGTASASRAEEAAPAPAGDVLAMIAAASSGGMWAYYIPKGMTGEFDSYDPIGLIAGDLIKTDCSLSWQSPEGKLYCFASGASLVYFKDWPKSNVQKAAAAYQTLTMAKPGF